MTNKEYKEYLSSLTLGELRSQYERSLENKSLYQNSIKEDALKLASLDVESKQYNREMNSLIDSLKILKTWMKETNKEIETIKPILDKKEIEFKKEMADNEYMNENETELKILIDAIEEDKQEFINNGCKVTIVYKGKEKEIELTLKQVNEMYELSKAETIQIIKNYCGKVIKVSNLVMNGNRGFDCKVKGDKGSITINTILAGGYNIQRLHYRTLVERY